MPDSNLMPYHKLGNINLQALLEKYIEGKSIPELAKELGANKSSLSRALRTELSPEQWAEAKELHYEHLLDDGLEAIRSAENDCNLARARESYLRRLEWRASVELPLRFGQRPNNVVQVSGNDLQINLVSFSPQTALQQPSDPEQE